MARGRSPSPTGECDGRPTEAAVIQMETQDSGEGRQGRIVRRGRAPTCVLVAAFVLSLALHVAAVAGLCLWMTSQEAQGPSSRPQEVQKVSARRLSSADWERNRSISQRQPSDGGSRMAPKDALAKAKEAALAKAMRRKENGEKKPEEKKVEKKKEETPPGKVVAVAEGNGQRPDESAFLAESSNKVERQTRSRHARNGAKRLAPRPVGNSGAQAAPPLSATNQTASDAAGGEGSGPKGNGGDGQDSRPKGDGGRRAQAVRETMGPEASKEVPRVSFQGLSSVPLRFQRPSSGDAPDGSSNRFRLVPGLYGSGTGETASTGMAGDGNGLKLSPSGAFLGQFADAAPAADLTPMDGVPEGEGTYLNTVEWKHAGFFNRIKQDMDSYWHPNEQIALKDPTGKAYLYKDRYTVVSVTLDGEGAVKKVDLVKPSGVDFLDKEATDAFRRAGAFPHPPTALQNDRGEIVFKFGFYIDTGNGRVRLFR